MTMNDITVVLYSYKGKILKDVVNTLLENASKNRRVDVIVIDQHPLLRSENFKDRNVMYRHIFWDWIHGPCLYKDDVIKNIKTKYTMILSDNVLLSKNWDELFVNFVNEKNIVLSGNQAISLKQDGLFYIGKDLSEIEEFTLTNYIDRSFIFSSTSLLKEIYYPYYLKYNGEEEVLSLEFFTKGIDIYACPTNTYTKVGNDPITELYVPFSVNHNYNEAIDLLKFGKNKFTDVLNRQRSIADFNNVHNNIFDNLSKLPFNTNDVNYFPERLDFDKIDARRFVARTRAIH